MSDASASPELGKRTDTTNRSLFDFYSRPKFYKALPISLQHLLAMIAGVITPPIIVAGVVDATPQEQLLLVQVAVLASGICTIFHLYGVWKFGARLPAISSAWASPMCQR
ncbi:solute carrier family 23 protein [Halomonas garicola]|uniref:solute carrier family 23 protein n=1 Tax=Halomonas garicola TaxID=1690008 RepID=UPI00289810C9|nr:solute carrier family 23 protein [Halomonas garicola]